MNLVGLPTFAGPQVYPGPGALSVKFLGTLTVLLVVPAAPTLSWNELNAVVGSCAQELITPPLQQFSICWLYGVPGNKSTTVGSFLQQCGMFPLYFEQSPCSVVSPPIMLQMTSFFAHVHPNVQPGA